MNLIAVLVLTLTYVLTFCNSQTYSQTAYSYPAQRRSGYSYTPPNSYSSASGSYYTNPKTYYSSTSAYPGKSNYQSTSAKHYATQGSSNALRGYSTTTSYTGYPAPGYSSSNKAPNNYRTPGSGSSSTPVSTSKSRNPYQNERDSSSSPYAASSTQSKKDYLTNAYISKDTNVRSNNNRLSQDKPKVKHRPNKADVENAKFAGVDNQEDIDEEGRLAPLKAHKFLRRRLAAAYHGGSRCFPYGRDAGANDKSVTPPPKEQGRFLFDLNVYNVYPQTSVGVGNTAFGCGGGLLGDPLGYGGGLLADPIPPPIYPIAPGINRFLSLWAPGILQNSLAVTARPQADPLPPPADDDLQSDPDVDPDYRPAPVPVRRRRPPNRIYYDSAGAPPVTPGQLVGGVSTTINGIIQQLTGNVQPVYQSYRRSASYG